MAMQDAVDSLDRILLHCLLCFPLLVFSKFDVTCTCPCTCVWTEGNVDPNEYDHEGNKYELVRCPDRIVEVQ